MRFRVAFWHLPAPIGGMHIDLAQSGSDGDDRADRCDDLAWNATQIEGLAELVELGAQGGGPLLLAEVGAWYAARGAGTERPLVATTAKEVAAANRGARAMLKLDGTLRGPPVSPGGHELAVGESVTLRDAVGDLVDVDGFALPPYAVFGTVEDIDRTRVELTVDFATAGRYTLALNSPAAAALEYGYAEPATLANEPRTAPQTVPQLPQREPYTIELRR